MYVTRSVSKVWSLLLIGWDSFWQLKQRKHPTSHGSPGPITITDETNREIGADATSTYDAARIQRSAKSRTAGDEMWWTVRSNWRRTALKTQLNADHVGPRTALSRVCWINDAISPLVEQSRAACRRAAITSLIGQPAKLHWQPNRVQSTADR